MGVAIPNLFSEPFDSALYKLFDIRIHLQRVPREGSAKLLNLPTNKAKASLNNTVEPDAEC